MLEGGTTVRGLVVLEAGLKFIVEPSGSRLACYDSAFTCLAYDRDTWEISMSSVTSTVESS